VDDIAASASATETLGRLADIAGELGDAVAAREARQERERVGDARFFVACVGQFKRGKSTLLNALLGRPILPVGVVPVTSVVTILRYGDAPHATVEFTDGRREAIAFADMIDFVDERRNAGNRRGAAAVELYVAADTLRDGLCLVDTPGLGSVHAANTTATEAFVPRIDVALVIVGPDPPISGVELDLVEEVAREAREIVVVMNKADLTSGDQARELLAFTTTAIAARLQRAPERIFSVSARERIDIGTATRDWAALEDHLRRLPLDHRERLLHGTARRAIRRIGLRVAAELRAQASALQQPLTETQQRVDRLRRALAEADRSLRDLHVLFDQVEAELGSTFEARRRMFVDSAAPTLREELRAWVSARWLDGGRQTMRDAAMERARTLAETIVNAWLQENRPVADQLYRDAMSRFVRLADGFLARVAGDVEEGVAMTAFESGLEVPGHFYFTNLMPIASRNPATWLMDTLAPRRVFARRVTAAAETYAHRLLVSNSHRVENDFKARTRESRRLLERAIRTRLTEATASAERALALAIAKEQLTEVQVRERVQRLRRLATVVDECLHESTASS
jgi:ribosome biogenesis GTPase A